MSAISNALLLIQRAVEHQADGLNFTALNEDSGIPQGSAHRLAKELVKLRILDYDPKLKTYRGGLMLASLGAQVLSQYSLAKVARPALEALQRDLGQVVTLGTRDGTTGIYIDKIEASDMGLRLHSEVGKAFPLHCTAMGKVLLANADDAIKKQLFRRKLPAMTPYTITDTKKLSAALKDVREKGYAIDDEEITRGFVCTAAPILGIDGSVTGALSFTCQKHLFSELGSDLIRDKVINAALQASA